MTLTKATVVCSLFFMAPRALPMPLPLPFALACELGAWEFASLQEAPLPLLSPPDGVVGVVPPPPFPPGVGGEGLVPCGEGEWSRNGTRKAPIPDTMSAAAPSLRLLGMFILFFLSPFAWGRNSSGEYIIQRIEHQRTCQFVTTGC